MNIEKLHKAESIFLSVYPKGFESEEMKGILKKHSLVKLTEFSHDHFTPQTLSDAESAAGDMVKLVSRSSIVSVFEKPRFRDAVHTMPPYDKQILAEGLGELLFGDEAKGFHMMLDVLSKYQLDKWTVISVFRCYYYPETDLVFKPTTVENVIKTFELEGLTYKPRPSYGFYVEYRNKINEMKSLVDPSLSPSVPAFSGFLMMAMDMLQER